MHVEVHEHADEDLAEINRLDTAAYASILGALEQFEADPRLIDKLTTHGDNVVGGQLLNVKRWVTIRSQEPLWRLRILNTPATSYRIVYGYFWPTRQVVVLAVVHKDELNYNDINSPLRRRAVADWEEICTKHGY